MSLANAGCDRPETNSIRRRGVISMVRRYRAESVSSADSSVSGPPPVDGPDDGPTAPAAPTTEPAAPTTEPAAPTTEPAAPPPPPPGTTPPPTQKHTPA